jgi:hypothetical protein
MVNVKMNASELIDDLIAKLTDWRGVTFTNIRKIIRGADPEIIEEWKWMDGLEGKKWRTIDFYKDDKINESSLAILVHSAVNHNQAKAKTQIKAPGTRSTVQKKSAT